MTPLPRPLPRAGGEQAARFLVGCDLPTSEPLALAVSGGPDSLALLLLAHAALPDRTIAATVDHGLRPEAAAEAAHVAAICAQLGIPHATLRVTVPPANLQAEARAARYAALAEWAAAWGATSLATAHHADDQAETLLMRLARGAGIAGLAGIRATRPLDHGVTLVRPLLAWRKAELAALADPLRPIDDPSNRDPRFDRTRARALLAETEWLDPSRLAATAGHLADAEAALAWTTARLAAERIEQRPGLTIVDPSGLPRELQRRLLVHLFRSFEPAADPTGPEIDRLLQRLAEGRVSTLGRLRFAPGPPWRVSPAPPRRAN